ncbi:hypothetical protein GQR58_003958 [Nymphon striatum]|nr:hypothetical protein GQR58_003958 [Nymphon striatum]
MSTLGKLGKLKSANKGKMTKLENKFESVLTKLAAIVAYLIRGTRQNSHVTIVHYQYRKQNCLFKRHDDKIVDLADEEEIENMVCAFDDYYNDKNDEMDKIQEKALKMALNGHNLLITGYPGTGKSFTVAHIEEHLEKQGRNVVLTTTTGKAAQALQEKLPKCLNKVRTCLEGNYDIYGTTKMHQRRFISFSDDELMKLLNENKDSKNTAKVNQHAVTLFEKYLIENGHLKSYGDDDCADMKPIQAIDWAVMDSSDLDRILCRFYAETRNLKGDMYKKTTMLCIRGGLNRHMNMVRRHKKMEEIDLARHPQFTKSHSMFKAVGKVLKKEGKASIDHQPPVDLEDLKKMRNYFIKNIEKPAVLQQAVFVYVVMYFARKENRGRENLRQLKIDEFAIASDADGDQYLYKNTDERTKNHQDDTNKKEARMYQKKDDDDLCPVRTFVNYKRKLNPRCIFLFQKPKKEITAQHKVWYDAYPIGVNLLGNMMPRISSAAHLGKVYTNHSLRATTITLLDYAKQPTKNSKVCSVHFKTEDFVKKETHRFLLPNTVPTIFGWSKPVRPSRKRPKEMDLIDWSRPAIINIPIVEIQNNHSNPDAAPRQLSYEIKAIKEEKEYSPSSVFDPCDSSNQEVNHKEQEEDLLHHSSTFNCEMNVLDRDKTAIKKEPIINRPIVGIKNNHSSADTAPRQLSYEVKVIKEEKEYSPSSVFDPCDSSNEEVNHEEQEDLLHPSSTFNCDMNLQDWDKTTIKKEPEIEIEQNYESAASSPDWMSLKMKKIKEENEDSPSHHCKSSPSEIKHEAADGDTGWLRRQNTPSFRWDVNGGPVCLMDLMDWKSTTIKNKPEGEVQYNDVNANPSTGWLSLEVKTVKKEKEGSQSSEFNLDYGSTQEIKYEEQNKDLWHNPLTSSSERELVDFGETMKKEPRFEIVQKFTKATCVSDCLSYEMKTTKVENKDAPSSVIGQSDNQPQEIEHEDVAEDVNQEMCKNVMDSTFSDKFDENVGDVNENYAKSNCSIQVCNDKDVKVSENLNEMSEWLWISTSTLQATPEFLWSTLATQAPDFL